MFLAASLCDAPHIKEFVLGKQRECICLRVAPDYAADLFLPIFDVVETQKEREIVSSTIYIVHVLT